MGVGSAQRSTCGFREQEKGLQIRADPRSSREDAGGGFHKLVVGQRLDAGNVVKGEGWGAALRE